MFRRRSERYRAFQKTVKRPDPMDRYLTTYQGKFSRYPELVRLSFMDGTTAVYQLKVDQPEPVFLKRTRRCLGYKYRG